MNMRFFKRNAKQQDYEQLSESQLREVLLRKKKMEAIMLQIADRFRSPDRFDSAVEFAIDELRKHCGAERAVILRLQSPTTMSLTHESTSRLTISIKRFMQNVPYEIQPWLRDTNIANRYIAVTNVDKMPPEAAESQAMFKKRHIGSILSTSFFSNYEFKGTIAVTNHGPVDAWDEDAKTLLMFICSLMEQIIERQDAEAKLISEKVHAEQSDKLKTAFISNLSHEIRTPLNSIVGFSQLIASNQLPPEKRLKISKVLTDNTTQLLSVMDDLMDTAQLQSDTIELEENHFPISIITESIAGHYRETVVNKGNVTFEVELDESVQGKFLFTDKHRLMQAIDYLVKNAIKFTEAGSIWIRIRHEKELLCIDVIDSGIGISKDNHEKIFDRFWQVDSSHTRKYGGNGLGLSIARNLAQLMGGTISVESAVGIGSCFSLHLPDSIIKSDSGTAERKRTTDMKRISRKALVADDFTSIHEYILSILEPEGFACTFANDGLEAMNLIKEVSYDLFLLDIQMPYYDGYEILKALRDMNVPAPIIAKTAHSTQDEADKFLKLGFDGFLAKPFKPSQLLDLVHKYFPESYAN